jgi:23S rRNA (guanosine2251-2'-O)-methyltransferase
MKKETTKQMGEQVFGVHSVIELLTAKRRKVISIYTTKPTPKAWPSIEKLLPKYPINIQYVDREVLTKMTGTTDHQGILAWAQPYPFRKQFFDKKTSPFLIMLDGVQDTRNVGAILRSAYCTGADGVIMTKKNSALLSAAAHKSSAGLAEHLQIYLAASPESAVQELKQAGYTIYLATLDGTDATKCTFEKPLCMVVGGEGFGISKTIYHAGTHITLPQRTADISYNVSVAAGILLFIVATQTKSV